MREIKFRAWDKEKKLMLYGIQNTYDTVKAYTLRDGTEIDQADTSFWRARSFGEFIERWPDVIMQFTGLKSKSGKDIYEGDLIKFEYGIGRVEFDEGMFQYKPAKGKRWEIEDGVTCSAYYPIIKEPVEVIGNIYENKESLEK